MSTTAINARSAHVADAVVVAYIREILGLR
jgi:hypothetical protein